MLKLRAFNSVTKRWRWIKAPPDNGGSQPVKIIDLGVIDFAQVQTEGPQTLYEMEAGEFLASIRFTDTDFEEPSDLTQTFWGGFVLIALGTVKSFGWYGFANWLGGNMYYDTTGLYGLNAAYGPDLGAGSNRSMILSAAAVGPIQAAVIYPGNDNDGWRLGPIIAWQAATEYLNLHAIEGIALDPAALSAIVANGTIWYNSGEDGTSGAMEPDFAGNAGGTVTDGPDIIWTDSGVAPLTAGTVRAVAEIWTGIGL